MSAYFIVLCASGYCFFSKPGCICHAAHVVDPLELIQTACCEVGWWMWMWASFVLLVLGLVLRLSEFCGVAWWFPWRAFVCGFWVEIGLRASRFSSLVVEVKEVGVRGR
jgi:hypothetical protein